MINSGVSCGLQPHCPFLSWAFTTVFLYTFIPDFVMAFVIVFKVVLGFLATYPPNCLSIFLDNLLFFPHLLPLLFAGVPSSTFKYASYNTSWHIEMLWYAHISFSCCVSIAIYYLSNFHWCILLLPCSLHKLWWEKGYMTLNSDV